MRLLLTLMILLSLNSYAQSLRDEIKTIYDFSPAKLSKEEQDKKIPAMDGFWEKVKSDTTKYLAELRNELQADGHPKFFYYDGGQLLLSVSRATKDKQTVLDGILKSDMSDIDRGSLVSTLNYIARSKLNTTTAALKILDDNNFKFFIPQHSFYFTQGYSFTYALLPTDPKFYVEPVIKRFKEEKEITAKNSIVTLLWFANTCNGNNFLREISEDKTIEKEVAEYAKDLLGRKFKKEKYYEKLHEASFDDQVKAQIASTNRMSDEAIYELDYITKLLRKNKCR